MTPQKAPRSMPASGLPHRAFDFFDGAGAFGDELVAAVEEPLELGGGEEFVDVAGRGFFEEQLAEFGRVI